MQSQAIPTGIDLGTVFSCVGIWQQSRVEIISNNEGNKLIPSCVAFTGVGRLIGDAAKNQIDVNPQNTVVGIRSLMGRGFDHPKVMKNVENHSFHVVNDCGRPQVQVDWKGETKYFAPEEISAMLLSSLKKMSENYQRTSVKDTVISVPAYFNSSQRKAVKDACIIAGLNVLRIISKPIAASLAYYFFVGNFKGQKNVLIFDLGYETTEVSIVGISTGSLEIKAVAFDQGFGGRDFDNRLVKHLTNEFKRKFKCDLKSHSVFKLQSAAQQAKHTLSSSTGVEIEIDVGVNFSTKVSRSKFVEICSALFRKTLVPVKKVLRDAKLDPSSIDDIVLVGGSTRIPMIKNLLQSFFINKTLDFPTDPEVIVAYGTAIYAAILSRNMSVGPQIATWHVHMTRYKIHIGPMSFVDVIPFSLSFGTVGGEISKIIKRNTKIPYKQTCSITTDADCQLSITVNVYEGERAVNINNDLLCTFQIREIPSAPGGVPKIDVTFGLDENGILEITAVENSRHISKPLQVVFHNNRGLTKEDVTKMAAEEAERCKEEDFGIGLQQDAQKGIKRRISE